MGRGGRSKSVVMVSPRYAPAIGGVEKHIEKVGERLAGRGHRVTVLAPSHVLGLPDREDVRGVSIRRIPYVWSLIWPLRFLWVLLEVRSLSAADIIHLHDVSTLIWGLPMVLVHTKRRVFITYHGYEKDPVPVIWRTLRHMASRLVEGELCIGRFIRTAYGVRCGLVSVGATDTRHFASDAIGGAVFVGRLEKDTGVLEYVRALGLVREEYGMQIPLTVCGIGSLEQTIRETARVEAVDVRLIGAAKDPMTSMIESRVCFAAGYLSILEAMSFGLPVIGAATSPLKIAYLKSMREAGAPISIQTSPEGIAEETVRVMNDAALRRSLSTRGRAFAAKMTWKKMADLYVELWSKGSGQKS